MPVVTALSAEEPVLALPGPRATATRSTSSWSSMTVRCWPSRSGRTNGCPDPISMHCGICAKHWAPLRGGDRAQHRHPLI